MRRMATLKVYVDASCWSCAESRRIVAEMRPQFPQVVIELVDLTGAKLPEHVFAVPTYELDGRVISLGNPYRHDLTRQLQEALEGS